MEYLRKLFYLFVFVLFSNLVSAQDNTNNAFTPYTHLPSIGAPSPNAASLGSYANYPVGSFTGVPEINIPLYEINEGGYKLPIGLSYNASGVKVDDVAGWTGLGWSLNAGGVITRNVVGGADDVNGGYAAAGSRGAQFGQTGFLFFNYNATADQASQPIDGHAGIPYFNPAGSNPMASQLAGLRRYDVDTEPDVFFFNFNGHVGKFVFSQGTDPVTNIGTVDPAQHKILLIPHQDLKISYSGTNDISSFSVVDEEGNQYLFANQERLFRQITENTFESQTGNNYSELSCVSGWYLTKITTIKGKVINFNYATETYTLAMPESLEKRGFYPGVDSSVPLYNTTSYTTILTGLRLTSIVGDDFEVDLTANMARQDLINTNALTSLKISLKDQTGNLTTVQQFNFVYNYLQSPNAPANDGSTNNAYERLMLNSVQEIGADGTTAKPPYQFAYNNTIPLPPRLSPQQDIWGYFNNNGTTHTTDLIPTLYVYPSLVGTPVARFSIYPLNTSASYFTIPGADRTTNPAAVLSGTLASIIYPTGGTTSFLLEPNQFLDTFNQNVTGGGLRLQQQTDYDGISHSHDIIKQYTYTQPANPSQSSGVLFNLPILAYTENFVDYWGGTTQTSNYPAGLPFPNGNVDDPTTIDYYYHNLVIGSVPQFTLSGFDSRNLGYSSITESINGNGKTIRTYSTPGRYGELSDAPVNAGGGCTIGSEGYCDGLFTATQPNFAPYDYDDSPVTQPSGQVTQPTLLYPDLTGIDYSEPYSLPYAPALNYDWNRGWLLSETKYSNTGNIVSQENNLYNTYTPQNAGPLYVYGLRMRLLQNYLLANNIFADNQEAEWVLPMYAHYCRYPIITSIAKQLSSKTINTYSSVNPTLFTTVSTNYTYSANCFKPSRIETQTSKGDLIDKFVTYPPDYTQVDANASDVHALGLYNIQQQHKINPVVEEYTFRKNAGSANPILTGAYLATFKTNSPLSNEVLPDAVYRSEAIAPLTTFTPASISNNGVTKDVSYKSFQSLDQYDGSGNINQDHLAGGAYNAYIWDYNNQYPIAKVTNAALNDVAYTSFEADGGESRWGISSSAITIDPTSPTGNKCYNLGAPYVVIYANGLNSNNIYIVSYWAKNQSTPLSITDDSSPLPNQATTGPTINGWTLYTHKVTGTRYIAIVGSCYIDEVRLYPLGAQMSTSVYDQIGNLIASADPKGTITHYEYDSLQRLLHIRDQYSNIVKSFCYNYAGQATNCSLNIPYVHLNYITYASGTSGYITSIQFYQGGVLKYTVTQAALQAGLANIPQGAYDVQVNTSGNLYNNGTGLGFNAFYYYADGAVGFNCYGYGSSYSVAMNLSNSTVVYFTIDNTGCD